MIIVGTVHNYQPVYTATHELARATFTIDGADRPFVAYGRAAERAGLGAASDARLRVVADGSVTLVTRERAYLVDAVDATTHA